MRWNISKCVGVLAILLVASAARAVDKPEPIVYYPAGADAAVPVAVWLHGYRSFPSALSDKDYFQRTADALHVAVVGIPGTTLLDDGTPVWSEEPAADNAYIQDVLAALSTKEHPLKLDRVALFGFSEGAMVAADLCARYPASYRGAIVMSPGGITRPKAAAPSPELNQKQVFFLCCGAKEHPYNVQLTRLYAEFFKKLSATVTETEYPDQDKHARPADFQQQFPKWIAAILALEQPK
jgi:predicted esterase